MCLSSGPNGQLVCNKVMLLYIWLAHMVTWHGGAYLFHWLDTNVSALARYKNGTHGNLKWGDMMRTVLVNQCGIMLPLMASADYLQWFAFRYEPQEWNATTLCSIVLANVVASYLHDIAFYVCHRFILHSKWGYRVLAHHLHHSTYATVAASSMYMAPVDFVLEIILPFFLMIWPVRDLDIRLAIWLVVMGGWGGLYEHSGYNFFPGVYQLDTRYHYAHHNHAGVSFSEGVFSPGLPDWLFRTSLLYLPLR